MILTRKAIEKINVTRIRLSLALALGFTEQWIIKLLDANKENGPLTTAKALQVIREETGLTDSEILEEEPLAVK
jgi:hypothetical protein